jgi:hypothetical protein
MSMPEWLFQAPVMGCRRPPYDDVTGRRRRSGATAVARHVSLALPFCLQLSLALRLGLATPLFLCLSTPLFLDPSQLGSLGLLLATDLCGESRHLRCDTILLRAVLAHLLLVRLDGTKG